MCFTILHMTTVQSVPMHCIYNYVLYYELKRLILCKKTRVYNSSVLFVGIVVCYYWPHSHSNHAQFLTSSSEAKHATIYQYHETEPLQLCCHVSCNS